MSLSEVVLGLLVVVAMLAVFAGLGWLLSPGKGPRRR